MITEGNFKELLLATGYTSSGELYEKKYPHFGTSMQVDFSKKKLSPILLIIISAVTGIVVYAV